MSEIRVLEDSVVNQIAAGEVVERPWAVVRELLDNSVDAGADDIQVTILDGGHTLIQVIDNGTGMSRDNALLAFERHATSKISSLSDLQTILTMGFRGEALSSIASVSRTTLRTKTSEDEEGTEIIISGGTLDNVRSATPRRGTEIEVRSLFFNTPARRKFLKSPRAEEGKIRDWILHSSLSRPHVRFRLFANEKEVLNLPRCSSMSERAKGIFRGTVVEVESSYDEVKVTGLLGHPSMAKGEGSFLIFVNGRLVTDRAILRAVRDGFAPTLKGGEFPVGYISVELPGECVDVNVNPQKSEVRFSNSQKVFLAVRSAVTDAVRNFRGPVSSGLETRIPYAASQSSTGPASFEVQSLALVSERAASYQEAPHELTETLQNNFQFSRLRYIGQIFECYLLCDLDERLYVVDMHAAHERYNYNLVRNGFASRSMYAQQLLVPLTVQIGNGSVRNIEAHIPMLEQFGFEIEPFGNDAVIVRSVPTVLQGGDIEGLVREISMLEDAEGGEGVLSLRVDHISARIACHGSIRSGRMLERDEVYALFEALDRTEFSSACPHGRPVIVSFSEGEIERWFGRDR